MPSYFCTATDVQSRLSAVGYNLRVDDDPSSIAQVLQRATNKVLYYSEALYDSGQLQNNADAGGWVNDKATDLAAYYLCGRRGNARPGSVKEDFEECMKELEEVKNDYFQIPNLAQRHRSSPVFSNGRVDVSYTLRKYRVETNLSEMTTPIGYVQNVDWYTIFLYEF